MDNLEFLFVATKIIVENCVKAKHEFAKKVNNYFQTAKIPGKSGVKLPNKRNAPEKTRSSYKNLNKRQAKKATIKVSSSSSECEIEYNNSNFSKISKISLMQNKTIDEEINEVFSSDDCSLFNTDTDDESISDLKPLNDLQNLLKKIQKPDEPNIEPTLEQLNKALDLIQYSNNEQKSLCKGIIFNIVNAELATNNEQVRKLFNQVVNKGKLILESLVNSENWKSVWPAFNEAKRTANNAKVKEIFSRIVNDFPKIANEQEMTDFKPFIKQVKVMAENCRIAEIKDLALKIISMWHDATQFKHKIKEERMARILEDFSYINDISKEFLVYSIDPSVKIKNKKK